jgi:hypothetical protein
MRLVALRGNCDIRAIARGAQRNREADPTRRAGDEQRFALERHGSSDG